MGNPSSFNDEGRKARKALEDARLKIARFLGVHKEEIVFTSSGTEANNLAIRGIARNFKFSILNLKKRSKFQKQKPHIITTQIEHPSVLEPIKELERMGFGVTYLPVDKEGFVDPQELKNNLRPETILVSVMYANNEIGTIEPIRKISQVIEDFKIGEAMYPLLHVDACQAAGYLDMNVNRLRADLLTFNGNKIYGPRGIGILYVRRGIRLNPEMLGGDQEFGFRAGTENLPAILGLAKAVELIQKNLGLRSLSIKKLRDYFIDQLKTQIPDVILNGPKGDLRLPNNVSISFPDLTSETILLELDKYGIYAGSGSACTARSVEPSHVLKAIGVSKKYINGTVRFSLGRQTTKKDIDHVLKFLPKVIKDLKKRYKV